MEIYSKSGKFLNKDSIKIAKNLVRSGILSDSKNIATYLQNDGEGQGNIEIKDPLEYHKTGYPYDAEKEVWKEIKAPTNTVLIFPGWVNHRSQENKVGGERMVMTYNINARLFKCDAYENRFIL